MFFLSFIDDCAKVLGAVSLHLFNHSGTEGLLYTLTTTGEKEQDSHDI